jgi:hypothetical protein
MKACHVCGKKVVSGLVICSECAQQSQRTEGFIDYLAEEIVLDEHICRCGLCIHGECQQQVSGLVCRNGVEAWLLEHFRRYEQHLREGGAA